ncbi:MAG: lipase [Planctomycetota bacterium]
MELGAGDGCRQASPCELHMPRAATVDIQISAEYVVNAIRVMHKRAGKKISIVGHSQGGMIGRWAMKYWPDTRKMVDDYVGLVASNHGTTYAALPCSMPGGCAAAIWQQNAGSKFITAINTGPETWPGVSYTEIVTVYDEIVGPSTSGFLTPGPNVTNTTVQAICPLETADHFAMAYDNAAWLVGIDALTHLGPARLSRVSRATCGRLTMPSVNLATFSLDLAAAMAVVVQSSLTAERFPAEPALRAYAR